MTTSGNYYCYPFIRESEILTKYIGPMVREDWLNDLQLEKPETIDEWENMLRFFKNEKKAISPLIFGVQDFQSGFLCGAYGFSMGFYIDNGIVKYGACHENFYDFLSRMHSWYEEGLIDKNFMTYSDDLADNQMINEKSGVMFRPIGSGMGQVTAMAKNTPGFKLTAVQYPVLNKGEKPRFSMYDRGLCSAAISSSCTNVAKAAEFLDYGYGSSGMMTYNFGIENESYVMVDGTPKYTDLILRNAEFSVGEIMGRYIRGNYNGPFIQMTEYVEQYYSLPEQKEALKIWSEIPSELTTKPDIAYDGADNDEMNELITKIGIYCSNMTIQFITGTRSMEEFDLFREEIAQLGVDRMIELYQSAYDSFVQKGGE